jgi:hypothetical protein
MSVITPSAVLPTRIPLADIVPLLQELSIIDPPWNIIDDAPLLTECRDGTRLLDVLVQQRRLTLFQANEV